MSGELQVLRLGRVEYEDGLALMEQFGEARRAGLVPDTLLLLEHPPVLTKGRSAEAENIVTPPAVLAAMGIQVHETNRGGDVTYHGPGQVVGYPIFLLPPGRQDVRRYVRDVEACVKQVLAAHGLTGHTIPKWPGVWVGDVEQGTVRKICAIGVHISRWLTSHGFALNVSTDLSHFGLIVPCGIREAGVTSLELELGRIVPMDQVEAQLARAFAEVFELRPVAPMEPRDTVAVALLRESARGLEVLTLRRQPARGGFWQIVTGGVEAGESAHRAAQRELREETGAGDVAVVGLDYTHAFCVGTAMPPRLVRESGFAARAPAGFEPTLDPAEHDASEWLPIQAALERLPFEGLRETVRRAVARLDGKAQPRSGQP